jgi:hypothetical protein
MIDLLSLVSQRFFGEHGADAHTEQQSDQQTSIGNHFRFFFFGIEIQI